MILKKNVDNFAVFFLHCWKGHFSGLGRNLDEWLMKNMEVKLLTSVIYRYIQGETISNLLAGLYVLEGKKRPFSLLPRNWKVFAISGQDFISYFSRAAFCGDSKLYIVTFPREQTKMLFYDCNKVIVHTYSTW